MQNFSTVSALTIAFIVAALAVAPSTTGDGGRVSSGMTATLAGGVSRLVEVGADQTSVARLTELLRQRSAAVRIVATTTPWGMERDTLHRGHLRALAGYVWIDGLDCLTPARRVSVLVASTRLVIRR